MRVLCIGHGSGRFRGAFPARAPFLKIKTKNNRLGYFTRIVHKNWLISCNLRVTFKKNLYRLISCSLRRWLTQKNYSINQALQKTFYSWKPETCHKSIPSLTYAYVIMYFIPMYIFFQKFQTKFFKLTIKSNSIQYLSAISNINLQAWSYFSIFEGNFLLSEK